MLDCFDLTGWPHRPLRALHKMAVEASEVLTSAAGSRPEQFCTASYGRQFISRSRRCPERPRLSFLADFLSFSTMRQRCYVPRVTSAISRKYSRAKSDTLPDVHVLYSLSYSLALATCLTSLSDHVAEWRHKHCCSSNTAFFFRVSPPTETLRQFEKAPLERSLSRP